MTAWVVGGVAAVVVIAALVFVLRNRYARVFTDKHLLEMCERLDDIRAAACARIEADDVVRPPASAEDVLADPRNAQTDGGMRMSYTVTRRAERPGVLGHYLAMSHEDKLPAESFARFFAGLAVVRFGLAPSDVAAQRSSNLVMHLLWEIAEEDNASFGGAREELPTTEELHDLRHRARAAGAALSLPAAAPSVAR